MKGPWESIACGREKGFKTQKLEKKVSHCQKRVCSCWRRFNYVAVVRELISEVTGMIPYEKHMMDILKVWSDGIC